MEKEMETIQHRGDAEDKPPATWPRGTRNAPAAAGKSKIPSKLSSAPQRTPAEDRAVAMLTPSLRHGHLAATITAPRRAEMPADQCPDASDMAIGTALHIHHLARGETKRLAQLLAAQALSLDTIFTDLARRATANLDDSPGVADRFMRLALKAAAGSRATIEALASLHRPADTMIPRVHVGEGGQAIVANQINNQVKGS